MGHGRRRFLARAGRRTNLALLWLVILAFLSGWVAFVFATPRSSWVATTVHALLGLGVVALAPWKTMIIRRSPLRAAGAALLVIIVVGLLAGFAQFFVGWRTVLDISPIQVHVGAALVAVPVLGWHMLGHRRQRFRRADLSRRVVLRGVALAGVVGAGYLLLGVAARWTGGPMHAPAATGPARSTQTRSRPRSGCWTGCPSWTPAIGWRWPGEPSAPPIWPTVPSR